MKMKKIIALMLAVLTAMAMFAACGKSEEAAPAEESADLGTIVVATSGSGEPYSLLHDDGTWTGIDADMWAEIEKRTGWDVQIEQAAFDAIWGLLDTERADVSANCWAVKPERVEKYYATIPYYGDAQCVIVPESNTDINEFADLAGKVVGVTNGQAAQTIIEDMGKEIGFEVVLYEDSAVAMNDLNLGRIDAFANTTTNVNNFMHYNEGIKFRFLEEDLMANNVAYFLPKTERGEQIRDELNKVLQEMLDDGTVAAITEKWMFADMTQLIQPEE